MTTSKPDLICFSHLRWNFVFQRPNHLMSLCSRERRVFFVEEPELGAADMARENRIQHISPRLTVVTPRLPGGADAARGQTELLAQLCHDHDIDSPIVWFYTPMALDFTDELSPALTVYDCMDELSAFRGASPRLRALEIELFSRADLVFTGGQSLFEAKRRLHPRVHLFPSSVDVAHFSQARGDLAEPADQANIPGPRIGFFGVIDERLDLELLATLARTRPHWSLVLVGPVVKIDPASLPRLPNLHYLGHKRYEELPAYLAGWQVAMMPFALNESTRFISPTKTLEYLAGCKPVVSTPIRDVIFPYAERGLVQVADSLDFVDAVEHALSGRGAPDRREIDAFLAMTSWERTWKEMSALLEAALTEKKSKVA